MGGWRGKEPPLEDVRVCPALQAIEAPPKLLHCCSVPTGTCGLWAVVSLAHRLDTAHGRKTGCHWSISVDIQLSVDVKLQSGLVRKNPTGRIRSASAFRDRPPRRPFGSSSRNWYPADSLVFSLVPSVFRLWECESYHKLPVQYHLPCPVPQHQSDLDSRPSLARSDDSF